MDKQSVMPFSEHDFADAHVHVAAPQEDSAASVTAVCGRACVQSLR